METGRDDDLKFPLTGRNIDTVSGRLSYDFYNGTVGFAANARFNIAETVSFNCQMPHNWIIGTTISPHFHWLQQHATNIPNWLLGYRVLDIGDEYPAIMTDFTGHTLVTPVSHAYTYTSGVLEQMTVFPDIDMSSSGLSANIHFCVWRDSLNTSTLFAGADPSAQIEHVREFDIHYDVKTFG